MLSVLPLLVPIARSIEFDCEGVNFATAGVSKRIKIYNCNKARRADSRTCGVTVTARGDACALTRVPSPIAGLAGRP